MRVETFEDSYPLSRWMNKRLVEIPNFMDDFFIFDNFGSLSLCENSGFQENRL